MRKKYKRYSKELVEQIVEYYFDDNTDKNLRKMADIFEVNSTSVSKIITKALKERRENSLTKRCMQYEFCDKQ
tara:strand:+ start:2929 stop:3147 length:219 start_codon:yes stop_codon:yes gene_type:complete